MSSCKSRQDSGGCGICALISSPLSRIASSSCSSVISPARLGSFLTCFCRLSILFCTLSKSARQSSAFIISVSLAGSTLPSTCIMSSLSKALTTCTMALHSRMWLKNLLPSPSPLLAPRTIPAMSVKLQPAGTVLTLCSISASLYSLASGTFTTPTFGSIVAKG